MWKNCSCARKFFFLSSCCSHHKIKGYLIKSNIENANSKESPSFKNLFWTKLVFNNFLMTISYQTFLDKKWGKNVKKVIFAIFNTQKLLFQMWIRVISPLLIKC